MKPLFFFVNLLTNFLIMEEEKMLPCMNKQLFGVECPGCGTQRALSHLSKGEFHDAFVMYPAIYTLIPFFIVLILHFLNKSRNYNKAIIALAILNGIVIIGSYLLKIFNQSN